MVSTFAENPEKFPEPHPKTDVLWLKSLAWLGLLLFQVQTDDGVFITAGPI
jgi:hypothetical protein